MRVKANSMKKIYRFLLSLKNYKLFFFIFFSIFFINAVFIITKIFIATKTILKLNSSDISLNHRILLSLIIAPLLETLIFQKLIFTFCRLYIKSNLICVVISAILFGLNHYNSITSIIQTFIIGIGYSLYYSILRKNDTNAFSKVALLHCLWNLLSITISIILK